MTEHTAPLPDNVELSPFRHGFSSHWMDVDRDPPDSFVDVLLSAIDAGYRRFDCNPRWDTEPMVAKALEQSSVPRDQLFVTTVVPFDQLGEDGTRASVCSSLERLGLDHLDAILVSAPVTGWPVAGTASAIDSLVDDGVVKYVGARYMCLQDIDAFGDLLGPPVFAHLTEMHPLWPAHDRRRHAVEHGYWIIADSPFMQGVIGEIREVRRAATRSDSTPFQVALAWLHQLPNVATSTWVHDRDRMIENLDADRLDLDRNALDDLASIGRRWSGAPHLHPVP